MSNSNPEPLRRVSKVYVAGSSAELDRAERAIADLEARGVAVTSTWPRSVTNVGESNPAHASRSDRARWAITCLHEVREADLVWMLVPSRAHPTRGAWLEAGYALARGKVVVFSGETAQSIFGALGYEFDHPDPEVADAAALALIVKIFDEDLRSAQMRAVEIDRWRREAEQWRIVAKDLGRRLRQLRGVDDPDLAAVAEGRLPEVRRG